MMHLYQCEDCKNQYVVNYGTIRCPHCDGKNREFQGDFLIEDINELLIERRELLEKSK